MGLPWVERPELVVDMALPPAQRLTAISDEMVERTKPLLHTVMSEIPPAARYLADAVRLRTAGRFHREAQAIAQRVGSDWRTIILANVSYDAALASLGCSTMALATDEGPVLARNMDWWPEDLLARSTYLFRHQRDGRDLFFNAGWPGAIGVVTGMSARGGFAVALNAVCCPEGISKTGYPVLLHLRRVLEDAADFDQALAMLRDTHLAAPGLFTLVGRENHQRVVIERAPKRAALRRAEGDAPLITTNGYRALDHPDAVGEGVLFEAACGRYDALCKFCNDLKAADSLSDEALLYMLTDTEVIQGITAQHIILRPARGQARAYVPRRLL